MPIGDKVICINLWSGGHVYVRTTEEIWKELTQDLEVKDNQVSGWLLDQKKIERIITGAYPEREDYQVVCRTPWRFTYEQFGWDFTPPTSNYWIVYSSTDMPTQLQGEFH
jgi:hypothetical protein